MVLVFAWVYFCCCSRGYCKGLGLYEGGIVSYSAGDECVGGRSDGLGENLRGRRGPG
jgi:hypothetical protein